SQGELLPYLSKAFLAEHPLGKKEASKEVLVKATVEALGPKFPSLANEVCDLLEKNYTQTSKIEKGFYNEGQAAKCRSAIIMENSIDDELTKVYDVVSKLEVDAYSRRSAVLGE
ncbi:MAG: hypothetical protein II467_06365, partial [Bacilli bacterium]|nr:hypothetical protein [Bacilli bacterium]